MRFPLEAPSCVNNRLGRRPIDFILAHRQVFIQKHNHHRHYRLRGRTDTKAPQASKLKNRQEDPSPRKMSARTAGLARRMARSAPCCAGQVQTRSLCAAPATPGLRRLFPEQSPSSAPLNSLGVYNNKNYLEYASKKYSNAISSGSGARALAEGPSSPFSPLQDRHWLSEVLATCAVIRADLLRCLLCAAARRQRWVVWTHMIAFLLLTYPHPLHGTQVSSSGLPACPSSVTPPGVPLASR